MPRRFRKSRKKRGTRTYSWGKEHRKAGARGGKGKAGIHGHKWVPILGPKHVGKRGFCSIRAREMKTINVGELEDFILSLKRPSYDKERRIVLDLNGLGYEKLLGKGKISIPVAIKVKSFSKVAQRKIQESGGRILGIN